MILDQGKQFLMPIFILLFPTSFDMVVTGFSCYECNSHYDPRCGDHFDNLTLPLTDCRFKFAHHLRMQGAHMCRKMIFYIHGEKRIVRECAFLGEIGYNDGRWCLERVGTKYIQYSVCQCNNKDGCNTAPATLSLSLDLKAVLVFVLFISTLHGAPYSIIGI